MGKGKRVEGYAGGLTHVNFMRRQTQGKGSRVEKRAGMPKKKKRERKKQLRRVKEEDGCACLSWALTKVSMCYEEGKNTERSSIRKKEGSGKGDRWGGGQVHSWGEAGDATPFTKRRD